MCKKRALITQTCKDHEDTVICTECSDDDKPIQCPVCLSNCHYCQSVACDDCKERVCFKNNGYENCLMFDYHKLKLCLFCIQRRHEGDLNKRLKTK